MGAAVFGRAHRVQADLCGLIANMFVQHVLNCSNALQSKHFMEYREGVFCASGGPLVDLCILVDVCG